MHLFFPFILFLILRSVQTTASSLPSQNDNISKDNISLACLMIARDEAENLSRNLPLWPPSFFDAYVIGIDDRTTDGTHSVLQRLLAPRNVPHYIFNYTFDNFGTARTTVLQRAFTTFPHVTHVMTVDPDWVPHVDTLTKADLERDVAAYQFKIWDRSGVSVRYANWLARHASNLTFAYYVHEDFRLSNGLPPLVVKELAWEVSEVEPNKSWHNLVGHGEGSSASRSHRRYYFDLGLLMAEQRDPLYRDSAHTLFYTGVVHAALLEGMEGYRPRYNLAQDINDRNEYTPAMRYHLERSVYHLEKCASLHSHSLFSEYVYLSLRWLGYIHHFLLLQPQNAVTWYEKCIAFDPKRAVDCYTELSKLYTFRNDHSRAWVQAATAYPLITSKRPLRRAWVSTYVYDCVAPLQVARAAINILVMDERFNMTRWMWGWDSFTTAEKGCASADFLVFEVEDVLVQIRAAYEVLATRVMREDFGHLAAELNLDV